MRLLCGDDVMAFPYIMPGPDRTCQTAAACDGGNPPHCDIQFTKPGIKQADDLNGYNDWPNLVFDGGGTIGLLSLSKSVTNEWQLEPQRSNLQMKSCPTIRLPPTFLLHCWQKRWRPQYRRSDSHTRRGSGAFVCYFGWDRIYCCQRNYSQVGVGFWRWHNRIRCNGDSCLHDTRRLLCIAKHYRQQWQSESFT